jgi:putative peptidoglycan lipid II flippase
MVVAAGFLGSRVLGLLRSVIIAGAFGTSPQLDAYWVAFRLPDLVFQLLAGATLASAFIPLFAQVRERDGEDAAWRLASSVLNLILLATLVFGLIAFILAPVLVPLMAPGLGRETGQEEELQSLAVELTRVMLLSPILFSISGMFMGILNARRHFVTPALAPMLYNLSIIVAALISTDVKVLAAAVVVGAALHLAVQLPDLKAAGMVYRFIADWKDRAVREVGALMAPRVLGLAAAQINFYFVAIFFASRLESGAISAVNFAWLIVMTPLGVIGMSISTAAFPTLAEQAARGDRAFATTLASALRLILFLSVPICLALVILARPIVTVLLQRGAFDVDSTDLTAQALTFYALAVPAHSGIEIVSRGFYATGDTKTPVAVAVASMVLNLVLAIALVDAFDVKGLGLALSIAATAEFAVLLVLVAKKVPGMTEGTGLWSTLARLTIAGGLSAAAFAGARLLLEGGGGLEVETWLDALLIAAVAGGIGGLVYLVATLALGLREPWMVARRLPFMSWLVPASRSSD